jgi:phenylpropionate dioxygenase-like ring-hydroxylating dioxygenase large terminal subunit
MQTSLKTRLMLHIHMGTAKTLDLTCDRPNPVTILGRELVLWRDQQGDWRAFNDVCPHRLAPLSGIS